MESSLFGSGAPHLLQVPSIGAWWCVTPQYSQVIIGSGTFQTLVSSGLYLGMAREGLVVQGIKGRLIGSFIFVPSVIIRRTIIL